MCSTPDCIKAMPCEDHDTDAKKAETGNSSFDEKLGTPISPISGNEDDENEKDPLID